MAVVKEGDPKNKRDDVASVVALRAVITALENLSEADRDRVMQSVIKFFNIYVI